MRIAHGMGLHLSEKSRTQAVKTVQPSRRRGRVIVHSVKCREALAVILETSLSGSP